MQISRITERELVIYLYEGEEEREELGKFCDEDCLNQYLLREYGTESPDAELGLIAEEELAVIYFSAYCAECGQ